MYRAYNQSCINFSHFLQIVIFLTHEGIFITSTLCEINLVSLSEFQEFRRKEAPCLARHEALWDARIELAYGLAVEMIR